MAKFDRVLLRWNVIPPSRNKISTLHIYVCCLLRVRDDAQIHYECDGEIPLPALSFEEAWKGLADQNQNPAASHAAGNILDALNREPQFEGPTPIQAAVIYNCFLFSLLNSSRDANFKNELRLKFFVFFFVPKMGLRSDLVS